MRIPAVVLLLILSCFCKAQADKDSLTSLFYRKFSSKQLQKDFSILRQGLEKAHAGLYRYTSKEQFDSLFLYTEKKLNKPMTLMEFYSIIGPVITATREDHTDIELPDVYNDYYNQMALLLPFNCRFLNGHAYITENLSADPFVKPGWEIISINDLPLDAICRRIFATFASDGFILSSKYRELDDGGLRSNYFKVFGDVTTFRIRMKDSLSSVFDYTITAQTIKQMAVQRKKSVIQGNPLHFALVNDSTALLRILTFSNKKIRSAGQKYAHFLDSCFRVLSEKHVPALIIDIRENGGGTEGNENLLFSYLAKENFRKYKYVEAATNKIRIDTGSGKPIRHKVFGFNERTFQNYRTKEGHLRRRNKGKLSLMAFEKFPDHRYSGKVYVLISGVTYSGASEFSNMMYNQQRAGFIGEECGGGYYGNTSGYSFDLTLPATGITISIPLLHFEMNVAGIPDGRGVIPHYTIGPSIQDYLDQQDAELNFAIKLAGKKED